MQVLQRLQQQSSVLGVRHSRPNVSVQATRSTKTKPKVTRAQEDEDKLWLPNAERPEW